jgi:hypothetical protein
VGTTWLLQAFSFLTCAPEPEVVPVNFMLAQRRSTNHEHRRGPNFLAKSPSFLSRLQSTPLIKQTHSWRRGSYGTLRPIKLGLLIIPCLRIDANKQTTITATTLRPKSEISVSLKIYQLHCQFVSLSRVYCLRHPSVTRSCSSYLFLKAVHTVNPVLVSPLGAANRYTATSLMVR